ncbi:FtsX-like permease family protein [Phytohabitans rumicis]|uniref:Membrane protein n=1 Tax=Phytohabitans rumicis TaxID=1076125 RepID=A0A6V8KZ29_9ACTN|nr:FtsX-like permease family protein [Phytohabitans rumicis]GFJ87569.1 membrane protein [Phytohabitans rumicis]
MGDLLLGTRMAIAGGRDGWTRALLAAVAMGIGVAALLIAAAVPGALDARQDRLDARRTASIANVPAADNTLLAAALFDAAFRDQAVYAMLLRPEGPRAPLPPGVTRLPQPGEVVVSPALRDLLASKDGHLFAPRLGGARVIGTIGPAGLAGPRELAYYLGTDQLQPDHDQRITAFGDVSTAEFSPVLALLIVVISVVLLLPIAVLIGAAVRFGGERRDRRLAALRLVGADQRMTRRVAAGEALATALLSLVAGAAFFLLGRHVVPLFTLWDISLNAGDLRPSPLLALAVALAVPALAVVVTMVAMRGVVIEPLGVTRRAGATRRRLWWRLILPLLGLAVLYPLFGDVRSSTVDNRYQIAAGAILLLFGAVALLPWVIDLVVRRIRGGAVPWQLAIRRLQQDSATSARMVNGVAVAVAGTIGLQMLFAGVEGDFRTETGADTSRADIIVRSGSVDGRELPQRLRAVPGIAAVNSILGTTGALADQPDRFTFLFVADCAGLAEALVLERCADGDVFVAKPGAGAHGEFYVAAPGDRLLLGTDKQLAWTVPASAREVSSRRDPGGFDRGMGLFVTPGAVDMSRFGPLEAWAWLRTDPGDRDALERVRNAAATVDQRAFVDRLSRVDEANRFVNVRRALYIGAVVTLLLVGASLLVGLLEHLRERRRLLAILVAMGTRRGTLMWSVVWQTVVPVVLGLALAVGFGLALGAVLLRLVTVPISVSWPVVGLSVALAAAVMALVTLLSLPPLWRLTRPDGLRTE